MSLLNNILSTIDSSATSKPPTPGVRPTQAANVSRPPRPASATNGASQAQPLKRKADGLPDSGQAKIQRKDGPMQPTRMNDAGRPTSTGDAIKTKPSASGNPIPYRGTASLGTSNSAKPSNILAKKPIPATRTPPPAPRSSVPAPKPIGVALTPGAAPAAAKKGSYAAMLQKAKEAQQAKPPTPPVRHEPAKILTKKERMALRAEASAAAKGKKTSLSGPIQTKAVDGKGNTKENIKEKRKPAESGYQGTARPLKKSVEIGYKGTARPLAAAAAGPAGKAGGAAQAKPKPKQSHNRYDGYANWSDLDDDDMKEEEEEGYDSDASSVMEGGMWDVEEEEQLALKVARKEDAEALAEENELKRQKEERKRKLMAMNKAAAGKRRY